MTKGPLTRHGAICTVLFITLHMTTGVAGAPEVLYPNELPGYKFFAVARWNVLRPFISTQSEALALLGPPQPVLYDIDDDWQMIIFYLGEGGSCDGKPWPSFLEGRVSNIQLEPKRRISFAGVHFPRAFKRSEHFVAHHIVDALVSYRDADGLEYELWGESSEDGSIHAGDLKAIIYGPSRKLRVSMTGCD